jgi:hypothetical protein
VLHYGRPGTLEELKPGMIFTIEPMINAGKRDIKEDRKAGKYDGWTIVTRDRSLSAQWEHTVLVTETGYECSRCPAGRRRPASVGHGQQWPWRPELLIGRAPPMTDLSVCCHRARPASREQAVPSLTAASIGTRGSRACGAALRPTRCSRLARHVER